MLIDQEFINSDVINGIFKTEQVGGLLGIRPTSSIGQDASQVTAKYRRQVQADLKDSRSVQIQQLFYENNRLEEELTVRQETRTQLEELRELAKNPTAENSDKFNELRDEIASRQFVDSNYRLTTIDPEGVLDTLSIDDQFASENALSKLDDFIEKADETIEEVEQDYLQTNEELNSYAEAAAQAGSYNFKGNFISMLDESFTSTGSLLNVLI